MKTFAVKANSAAPRPVAALLGAAPLVQTFLQPAANQAARINHLWWLLLVVCSVVWGAVVGFMLWGAFRRVEVTPEEMALPIVPIDSAREGRLQRGVGSAVAATVIILLGLLLADFFTDRAISAPAPQNALKISLVGHQWWWEVKIHDDDPSRIVTTANELHIPLGRPVKFELQSNDVIHSFWVPSLHGKRDLIPGHPTTTWFTAHRAGTYHGMCAEYCGAQHAHMRLSITVDEPRQYEAWAEAQRQSAAAPEQESAKRGQQLFLGTTCVMCHAIAGTPARANAGPDLTHLQSRAWIGAGAVPNERPFLAEWVTNPQAHKPGAKMPQNTFTEADLKALVDYLQTLK